jgi:hypothetical protein
VGYSILSADGLPVRDFDDSFRRLTVLRSGFHPHMEAFIDELLAPRGFWGVTSAEHLAEANVENIFGEDDVLGPDDAPASDA